jgi:DsbE subfamily thiol:disulfide oxidoreductase
MSSENISFFKKSWVKNTLPVLIIIIAYFTLRPLMQDSIVKGPAPDFTKQSLTGKKISLKDYQGKPVLVHFWATWCPICREEHQEINEISKHFPVINVATQSDSGMLLRNYVKQYKMNPDIIISDSDGSLMKAYKARAVPSSFIIDANGQIQYYKVGYSTSYDLKKQLNKLTTKQKN